jgi:hypothetical protein
MNTGLFSQARVNISKWESPGNNLDLKVDLQEAWYIYPLPLFELADRNFNVWWREFDHKLSRTNFGLRFYHLNFSGRKDYLKLMAQFGYTWRYSLQYTFPYLNKNQSLGLTVDLSYNRNREVQYQTIGDKQQFFKNDEKFLLNRFETGITLSYRPAYKFLQALSLYYRQNNVDSVIAQDLNPNFFLDAKSRQRFFTLAYTLTYDNRNMRPYPTKGNYLEMVMRKQGLGIFDDLNTLTLIASYTHYFPFGKKWNFETLQKGTLSVIRTEQPYFNYRALGFNRTFVRGYEYYIIDGMDFFLTRNSLRFELVNREINWGKLVPIKPLRTMPLRLYLALNGDAGYVNDPFATTGNVLGNRFLVGGGLGLNLVMYYDKVFKLEYSFNGKGESGFFLNTELGF